MEVRDAEKELRKRLDNAGRTLNTLTPAEGMKIMLAFYNEQRAKGCEIEADGDMLLYQWGASGDKPFTLCLARQFMVGDDGDICQLSLTFSYMPTPALQNLNTGSFWCHSPDEWLLFRRVVERHAAFNAVGGTKVDKVTLHFGVV